MTTTTTTSASSTEAESDAGSKQAASVTSITIDLPPHPDVASVPVVFRIDAPPIPPPGRFALLRVPYRLPRKQDPMHPDPVIAAHACILTRLRGKAEGKKKAGDFVVCWRKAFPLRFVQRPDLRRDGLPRWENETPARYVVEEILPDVAPLFEWRPIPKSNAVVSTGTPTMPRGSEPNKNAVEFKQAETALLDETVFAIAGQGGMGLDAAAWIAAGFDPTEAALAGALAAAAARFAAGG